MGSLQIFEIVQIVPNRAKHLVKGVGQIQKSTAWVIWNLFFFTVLTINISRVNHSFVTAENLESCNALINDLKTGLYVNEIS